MPTNFPTSLDTLTNPAAGDAQNSPSHSGQHANANDAIEALEAKVGTGASTPTANTLLRGTGVGSSAYGQLANGDVPANTIVPSKLAMGATSRIVGRATAGAGAGEELTGAQVTALLDFGEAGDISTQAFGDAAAAGATGEIADAGHKHAMPANPTVGLVNDIAFVIDGGGAVISTGVKGDLQIDYACTIVSATLLADQSGSIVVNVWKDTYANYPPTVADKITASAPPTISSATKSTDSTLTGWGTGKNIAAGDILRVNVDSVTTIQRVTLILKVTRT